MAHNLLLLLVFCALYLNIHAQTTGDENSKQISPSNKIAKSRGFGAMPKFIIQMAITSVRNVFKNLQNILQSIEKYAISMVMDTLSFLAKSDNTTIARSRRSTDWSYGSKQNEKQNGGGLISTFSKLFMSPFKLAFGTVKWIPGAIIDRSAKIGIALAGDLLENPMFQSMAHAAIATADTIAEESWNFAKVNVFPKMDKWVTSVKESHSLPDSVITFLTEMQTLYHIYRFLGLA